MQHGERDIARALPAVRAVERGGLVKLLRDVVQTCDDDDEVKAHVLPHDGEEHREEIVRLILPVQPFNDHFSVRFDLIGKLPRSEQDLVYHAAERRGGNDDGEKVYRAEHLRADADRIHEQRQNERHAHLDDHSAHDHERRVLERGAHVGVGHEPLVVFVPRRIHAVCGAAETADVEERIDDVLNERIVKIHREEQKRRHEKHEQRPFSLVDGG